MHWRIRTERWHIVWPPDIDLNAHDHNIWTSIGIYAGREDNQFYRRVGDGRVDAHNGKTLLRGDTMSLGSDVVHSVKNPTCEWTAAIHVYGGDLFTAKRTTWDPETLEPADLDPAFLPAIIEDAATRERAS